MRRDTCRPSEQSLFGSSRTSMVARAILVGHEESLFEWWLYPENFDVCRLEALYIRCIAISHVVWLKYSLSAYKKWTAVETMGFSYSPALNMSLQVLQGTANTPRKYGYHPDERKKRILLNAFDMNGIGLIRYLSNCAFHQWGLTRHLSAGQWRNPQDKSVTKNRLEYWC